MKRQKRRRDDLQHKKLIGKLSDDSGDEVELFLKKTTYQEPPTVEKVVEEGDTLQSLAIRYGCSVAELKRLNHILNDNEIYAKGVVKVPDRPLSAILAGVHNSGRNSPNGKSASKKTNLDFLEYQLKDTLFLNVPNINKGESFNEVIFNSTISSKTFDNTSDNENENLCEDEEVTLLPKPEPVTAPTVVSKYTCSGADADISWIALIVCAIIVIVAVPLIYSFYIYEHPEQYHQHIVHTNNHSS